MMMTLLQQVSETTRPLLTRVPRDEARDGVRRERWLIFVHGVRRVGNEHGLELSLHLRDRQLRVEPVRVR